MEPTTVAGAVFAGYLNKVMKACLVLKTLDVVHC